MELLLIRHSITPGNLLKQYVGSTDHPLAPEGKALARKAKEKMPEIDGLWASPMLRCRQTAEILFPTFTPFLADDLRELDFGDFEGKVWEELKDLPVYQKWIRGENVAFPNGENMGDYTRRCLRGIRRVVEEAKAAGCRRAGVVAHGGVQMIVMDAFATPKREFYRWHKENCGGFLVDVKEEPLIFELIQEL